jgi:hypothetical protein
MNAGENRDIKLADKSYKNVSQFKYLRTTVTTQHLIEEEIKRRLNSGNACYQSVQNQPVVLHGSETCSLTLRENHKMRMFKKRVMKRNWTEDG